MAKIAVIGSGFGGLSSAALLAKEGHSVELFEKNPTIGGRARLWKKDGFSFDMGPSWYLMPEVFERFFSEFSKKPEDYYTLKKLDPQYRMFFGKDDSVDLMQNLEENMKLFDSLEKDGAKKLLRYLDYAKTQYNIAMEKFVYKNYSSIFDFFNKEMMTKGLKMKLFTSLDKYTKKFFRNPRARKILLYTTVFLGGSPKKTPALYSLMSHVDFNLGVSYPLGGLNAVAEGMAKLCREQGVKIHTNSPVEKIRVSKAGKAKGIVTGGKNIGFDIVVSDADYHHTEMELLAPEHRSYSSRFWKKSILAPSAFIIYLGLEKKVNSLLHHTLILSNDWMKHFESIFDEPAWPKDPSYYVCTPSKTEKSVAPKGKENLFILVPAASGLEDSDKFREQYSQKILKHLEGQLGEDIIRHIIVKRIFTQKDFLSEYNSFKGTALGLAHTMFQTAIFRPSNKSKKVKNLFYVGQSTNPGIGVPMVIISGHVVRDIVRKEKH